MEVISAAAYRASQASRSKGTKAATKAPQATPVPAAAVASPVAQEMTFAGVVPGLNGSGGLLRMHWSKRKALGGLHGWQVRSAQLRPMAGPVRLELIRYSAGGQMDYDNLVSTGKSILDAIVRSGILPDDNPQVITERTYTQVRCRPAEQRTVIRLTPLASIT